MKSSLKGGRYLYGMSTGCFTLQDTERRHLSLTDTVHSLMDLPCPVTKTQGTVLIIFLTPYASLSFAPQVTKYLNVQTKAAETCAGCFTKRRSITPSNCPSIAGFFHLQELQRVCEEWTSSTPCKNRSSKTRPPIWTHLPEAGG